MSSARLKSVYSTQRWKRLRLAVIARDGHQCTAVVHRGRGLWTRCTRTTDLTVDHMNDYADPFDERFLRTLCRTHHGKKDGGKRIGRRPVAVTRSMR